MLSIVVATFGRREELERLFESIEKMSSNDYEVIIVDQNPKDYLKGVIPFKDNYKHYNVSFVGVSKARNFGLKKSLGEFVLFSDDDALLEPDLINIIEREFSSNQCEMISLRILDTESNAKCMLDFPDTQVNIAYNNFYKLALECSQVWRKSTLVSLKGFDERLGVGTYFGAEEGNDLLVRGLASGSLMKYIPETGMRHPLKNDASISRYYKYSRGTGALLRKHVLNFPVMRFSFLFLLKSIVGTFVFIFWKPRASFKYAARITGFLIGFYKFNEK